MKHDTFHAVADVYAVPRPRSSKYYVKDWGKSLFSCIVSVDPSEGQANVLRVKLEDRKNHSLIAVAPYDGQHGIASVADSARHYVLLVRSPSAEAWLGVGFRDPTDSIDFSLAIQTFMRRRMFEDRLDSPGWSTRKTANLAAKKQSSVKERPISKHVGVAPLITPPPTESSSEISSNEVSCDDISASSSEEEFGEFQ